MAEAILYSFRRCPYAMRGRIGLYASDLKYEHREIVLRDKPEHMLEVSPKGTVPVFIKNDGSVIDESLDLLLYSLETHDPFDWLNCDRDEARNLISDNDGPFKHHLDRYKYASRYSDEAKRGDTDLSHRQKAETFLAIYEERLNASKYLLGDKQTIADIAIFPFVRQFANTDINWWTSAPYPKTRNWLDRHTNADIFKAIMHKFPLWHAE